MSTIERLGKPGGVNFSWMVSERRGAVKVIETIVYAPARWEAIMIYDSKHSNRPLEDIHVRLMSDNE